MAITFEEAIENHRKMWNWIADETEKRKVCVEKYDYIKELNIPSPINYCFCCKYTEDNGVFEETTDTPIDCRLCPVDWGEEPTRQYDYQCADDGTLYDLWGDCLDDGDWEQAAKYAREIANIPIRRCS